MALPLEFQAVVMAAGKGSRMTELTNGKPKCLLPVGNKPLVWYPLHKLQESGFEETILVIQENKKSEIQSVLDKTDLTIKIEYYPLPDDEDYGTADTLRLLSDKLNSNVLVFSCDLVSDLSLQGALDLFRMNNASIVSVLLQPQKLEDYKVPGPKSKLKKEPDFFGVEETTKRLVFQASSSDYEESIRLPRSLFKKHPRIKMLTTLVDSHVYLIKNWVIKYLGTVDNISTIKGELIPHVVKKQLSKPPKPTKTNTSIVNTKDSNDIFTFARDSLHVNVNPSGDNLTNFQLENNDIIKCYTYVTDSDTFGIRVNTIPAYWAINKQIKEKWDKLTNGKPLNPVSPKAEISSNQVDENCFVAYGCKLFEKTSFKNCLILPNTEVHSFSRVFDSIIMNNVTIKEKVAIENSIICNGTTIESGCKIKNSIIGSNYTVSENSQHSNEILTDSEKLMEF